MKYNILLSILLLQSITSSAEHAFLSQPDESYVELIESTGEIFTSYELNPLGEVKDVGVWGDMKTCPNEYYVCGMGIFVQAPQGKLADDVSTNSILMKCCNSYFWSRQEYIDVYSSSLKLRSNFYYEECPTGYYIVDVRVQIEGPQGNEDDTGLNGIEFLCWNKAADFKRYALYNNWGSWGKELNKNNSFVVGVQVKYEPINLNYGHDNSSITGLKTKVEYKTIID